MTPNFVFPAALILVSLTIKKYNPASCEMYPPPLPGKQLSAVISILEVDMYKYLSIKALPPAKDMASHPYTLQYTYMHTVP
jgi:hypothetical protein